MSIHHDYVDYIMISLKKKENYIKKNDIKNDVFSSVLRGIKPLLTHVELL